jgi:LAO/AO transport system kinase
MDRLSRQPNAFIRPSPSGGTLGGVTRKSRETILVCEAAGFDTVLVETVGVGQSETTVRSMTDFFLLVMLTGAGDELQGIKKGVIELADALLINKADGDNIIKAQVAKEEYNRVLHYLKPASEGWMPEAYTCSALTGAGVAHIWDVVERFRHQMQSTGTFEKRRKSQVLEWVYTMVQEHLQTGFFNDPNVKKIIPGIEQQVSEGSISATIAAKELLAAYEKG